MNANVTFMNDNIETLAHLPFAASCSAPTPFLPGSLRVIDIIDRSSLSSASPGATAFPLRPWVARIRPSTSVGTIKIEPECLVIFDWSPPIPHSFSGLQYIKAIKVYSVKITFVGIDQLYPRFALEVVNSGIAKMGISRAEWWTFPNFATKAAACSNLQTLVWYLRLYKFPALPPDAFQFLSHHDYRVLVGIKQYNLETIDTFSFKSGSST
ncbi:hypothetical protein CspHIS471_0302770 [Cutaneotrichosporon sp. HIS471]|nr:hypothetical protein CspHIS471_0302770 [Cutaneotrichosporon sp. HIS471]